MRRRSSKDVHTNIKPEVGVRATAGVRDTVGGSALVGGVAGIIPGERATTWQRRIYRNTFEARWGAAKTLR